MSEGLQHGRYKHDTNEQSVYPDVPGVMARRRCSITATGRRAGGHASEASSLFETLSIERGVRVGTRVGRRRRGGASVFTWRRRGLLT
eukprot:CAMPEP_0206173220 /NCGR_PEP_ID=MMETSP1474-20131121/48187_1 /ASSEMBLY_ACC=CAM_ASM_001110 /TAXON_ID=97495 /ORGANISM="Imantonia sp., Strain RCC918" /LENGTH=87 /DNA_ID=CAMNT_0053581881 /DNA_START=227 /DNA_END=487 /DNA_ORIENTATION=-